MNKKMSDKLLMGSKEVLISRFFLAVSFLFVIYPLISQANVSPMTDQSIKKAVEWALFIDEGVPANSIDIELDKGVVSLTGVVPHLRAKERATLMAETTKGVQSIVNRIRVVTSDERSDRDVKADVQEALQEDPVTDSLDIAVTAQNGVVVLGGSVPSLAARALAWEITAGVWGVEEVKNNLTVNLGSMRHDQDIKEEISSLLENNVWINENPIQVKVQEGQVTLKGVVGSLAEKRRVRRVAMVKGVSTIDDRLLFIKKWAQGEERRTQKQVQKTDQEIKDVLNTAFLVDPRISLGHLTVEVQDGVVTLQGIVPHVKIKKEAEKVAKHTRGVLWVENFIKVRPREVVRAENNERIEEKVNRALRQNVYVNSHNINASVLNGKVYLAGTAHSNFEKEEAERTIGELNGVTEIENQIIVQDQWKWKPDKIIYKDVNDEFWWSPFVDSEEIGVKVQNGTVTLQGTVNSWWEQEMAVRNAYEGGARYVENRLTIQ